MIDPDPTHSGEDTESNEDTIEIHGHESKPHELEWDSEYRPAGVDEGVYLGEVSGTTKSPSLQLILGKWNLYITLKTTNIVIRTVELEKTWTDSEDHSGKTADGITENAIENALEEAKNIAHGFRNGWRYRHENGVFHPELEKYAEEIKECESVINIVKLNETDQRMRVRVELSDSETIDGFAQSFYDWIADRPDLETHRLIEHNSEVGYGIIEVNRINPKTE